jgi:hypothetical protein
MADEQHSFAYATDKEDEETLLVPPQPDDIDNLRRLLDGLREHPTS